MVSDDLLAQFDGAGKALPFAYISQNAERFEIFWLEFQNLTCGQAGRFVIAPARVGLGAAGKTLGLPMTVPFVGSVKDQNEQRESGRSAKNQAKKGAFAAAFRLSQICLSDVSTALGHPAQLAHSEENTPKMVIIVQIRIIMSITDQIMTVSIL